METRLQILHDAQVINQEVYQGMLAVLDRLEQHWQLPLGHAQGEMMITHMANAMMRAQRGEPIPAIDAGVLAEVHASEDYARVLAMHHDLLSLFSFAVPDYEQGYLLANLYGLVLARQESAA